MLAIWEPILAGDSRSAIDRRMFDDPRVQTFWDPHKISGAWFGNHPIGSLAGGVIWDAYYAFKRTATWQRLPSGVVATGSDIIGNTDRLKRAFVALLRRS